MIVTRRDTEHGAGQERVAAAASLYGWTEVDYRAIEIDIPSSERVWTKGDCVVFVRLGETGQVLAAWAYRGTVEDRAARERSLVIGAVMNGRDKAGRAVELFADATAPTNVGAGAHDRSMATPLNPAPQRGSTGDTLVNPIEAIDGERFFPDDALPIHHLDEDLDGRQRGVCPHSGGSRTEAGGCPRGCDGATEHYSNDGHKACHDPAPIGPRTATER